MRGNYTIILPLLLFIIQSISASTTPQTTESLTFSPSSKIFCRFRTKEYSPGDIWYPTSTSSSSSYSSPCVVCTCLNSGKQNCTQQQCPNSKDCDENSMKHPCCKSCEERDAQHFGVITNPQEITSESGEVVEEPEEDDIHNNTDGEIQEFVSCLHRGKIYKEGESFTADVTGLPIYATDQCLQCVCQRGMVLCQMKACSSFNCTTFTFPDANEGTSTSTTDACCQRCAAWRKPRSESDDKSIKSRSHSHPSWNPSNIVSNSKQGRFTQDLVSSKPRDNPNLINIEVDGDGESKVTFNEKTTHYDDCVSAGRFYHHGSTWHPIIGPFGPMECITCKCLKGLIECSRLKCQKNKDLHCPKPIKVEGHCCPICPSLINISNNDTPTPKLCSNLKQDVIAFKSLGIGLNDTEVVNFAFINEKMKAIDLHEWNLKEGKILQFSTKFISILDFNEIKSRQVFILLGATNEKNLDKFTKREKKLERRCIMKCSPRISGLERSLKIHKLVARKECFNNERNVPIS